MPEIKTDIQKTVVGQSVRRLDALEKTTGKSKYASDLNRPGMLHAVTVRSPWASMTDVTLDTSSAQNLPGVVQIASAAHIPGANIVPLVFMDQPFLAESQTKFHGEAVALVAAETLPAAIRGAQAVKVNGKRNTPCIDIHKALESDAPCIYGDNNIVKNYEIKRGDLDKAFKDADIILEHTYTTPHQVHAYLEPQGMLAELDDQGGIRIEGSMQCPFYVQDAVAAILGIPKHKVTVIQSATGGGFGGKEDVPSIVAGHAALLAWLTHRPVRLIYNREEDFQAMSKRHPSHTRIRIAARNDGTLQGIHVDYRLNAGAYATLSPIVLWRGTVHAAGPYKWNAVLIETAAIATNTVPCGAFRGFGQPQVAFAIESMMDELALKLRMNPLTLRRQNMLGIGDITACGYPITESCGMEEAVDRGAAEAGWDQKWKTNSQITPNATAKLHGIGCAFSYYGVGLGAGGKHLARAGALVQVENDATVRVYIGNTEMGQGARSVIAQIAAESLNAPYDNVNVCRADTSRVPDSGPTVASRTTVMSGNAVMDAGLKILSQLKIAAAKHFNCEPDAINSEEGCFFASHASWDKISFSETVTLACAQRLPLAAAGWFTAPDTSFDEKGQGQPYMTYVWSANFAEVSVDPLTLEVDVIKLTAAHDVGFAVNPREVAAQIQGGALQGYGYALMEQIKLDPNGKMMNPNFNGYIIPTAMDVPEIVPIIVEHPFRYGPYGAKGIGEPPLIAVAPAIANAVANAVGLRVRNLPVSPENLLESLEESGAEK